MASPTPTDHLIADIIGVAMACVGVGGIVYAIWLSAKEDRDGFVVIEGEHDEHDERDEHDGHDGAGPDEGDRS